MSVDFLARAIELASQVNPHDVRPNPRVGCVIVQSSIFNNQSSKKIISEGIHKKFGGFHAERDALEKLGKNFDLRDCEVYVTLEPCDHFEGKKTPSCTELLIQKKPKKIIVGALDPKFQGKNVEKLRQAGIEVEVQNYEACEALNPFWHKFATTGLPYVTLKLAQSLDGRITCMNSDTNPKFLGFVSYISNELSRKKVHEMRAEYSAILTTTETILADDPRLDCRLKGTHKNPDILVIGKREIPQNAKIFGIPNRQIHFFPTHDLESVLRECGKMGIDSVMTECGSVVTTLSLQKNLVDEIQLFIAPEIFGIGKSSFVFVGDRYICPLRDFQLVDIQNLEEDIWVQYKKSDKKLY